MASQARKFLSYHPYSNHILKGISVDAAAAGLVHASELRHVTASRKPEDSP
jgi:hypothetical protein